MKELVDAVLSLGFKFVNVSQNGAAPLYPIFQWLGQRVEAQPFDGGIVFSYVGDDEPYAILLGNRRCWSFTEYAFVPESALFDEETWRVLLKALGETLADVKT